MLEGKKPIHSDVLMAAIVSGHRVAKFGEQHYLIDSVVSTKGDEAYVIIQGTNYHARRIFDGYADYQIIGRVK